VTSPMAMYKSPLHRMSEVTPTDYWNDSCNTAELEYAIEHGAVGATTNPIIVHTVLQQQLDQWRDRIRDLIAENPGASEADLAWRVTEEIVVKAAGSLRPVFEATAGAKGRIAIQTNPQNYRSEKRIVQQALHFHSLAPNLVVKVPATCTGIAAAEQLTYLGVSIVATLSFTVAQVLAVAEAVERGLKRREAEGKVTSGMAPIAVIMIGRVDDWLKVVANKHDIIVAPDYLEWAGVAVMKHAYRIFRERGYRTRLLAAAYRNHYHWSEFIGGDMITSIPYRWAKRFNGSDVQVRDRIEIPVDAKIVGDLRDKFEDFRKAYDPHGMSMDEFGAYGATVRTLRDFCAAYLDMCAVVRDFLLPNPDK
jgi:transaldolase